MPMGIVSDKDFQAELGNLTPCPPIHPSMIPPTIEKEPIGIVEDMNKGRSIGGVEVPESLRKLIGDESVVSGRASALELANQFGISPSSVSAYSNGANSTASYDDQPNLPVINNAKLRIAKKARKRLLISLNALTEDKINSAKVKDISGVAKDMSAIIKNMEPPAPVNNDRGGPTFIFYSPQMRNEKVFDVIHVKE